MNIEIIVEHLKIPFNLDWETHRWSSVESLPEVDFPIATQIEGNRYLLYSDGTFAEVEK